MEPRNGRITAAMNFLSRKPFAKVGFRAAFAYALDGVRHSLRQFGVVRGSNMHAVSILLREPGGRFTFRGVRRPAVYPSRNEV